MNKFNLNVKLFYSLYYLLCSCKTVKYPINQTGTDCEKQELFDSSTPRVQWLSCQTFVQTFRLEVQKLDWSLHLGA